MIARMNIRFNHRAGVAMWAGRTLIFALAILAVGCSPLKLINASLPEDQYSLNPDIAYGDHRRQRLDVYTPKQGPDVQRKVAVFFYGGRWQFGSKSDYLFVAEALAREGIITVIPDYTLYPEVRYPAFIEDGARAVAWVREHIDDFGGDPDSIYLIGHSSGAYIATMLNLNESFMDTTGVRGTVGIAGPYDFLPLGSDDLRNIFSTADTLSDTQPISHVDGDEPPMLLITGRSDLVVDPGNSRRLAASVREKGGEVDVRQYHMVGHRLVVGSIARQLRLLAPTFDDIIAFIAEDAAP
jgi:acetyl esterase/lipase